ARLPPQHSTLFPEDQHEFVCLVDPEDGGVAEGAEVVVLLAAVPDDQVVVDVAGSPEAGGEVAVERVELRLLAQVHDDDAAIGAREQGGEDGGKDLLEAVEEGVV